MSFLSPLWLGAVAALLLPFALHLISRGRGKRVRVGSIALLAGTERRRARRVWPSQLLLLLVRCLLLAALALALATPMGWPVTTAAEGAVTVLVSPGLLAARAQREPDAPTLFAALDTLQAAGHPVHLLVPGLPVWQPGDALPADNVVDLWSLLGAADRAAAPGTRLAIFAVDRLADLRGERPALQHAFSWQALMPRGEPAAAPIPVGPSTVLAAAIYAAPERADDAAHIRAALAAAADVAGIEVAVQMLQAEDGVVAEPVADLAVWLTDAPVPAGLVDRVATGGSLLRDTAMPYTDCDAIVRPSVGGRLVLRRCVASGTAPAATLWRDSSGAPFLSAERQGDGIIYHLHSRFDPAWSDFVLQPLFPAWWLARLEALAADDSRAVRRDSRHAAGQGAPRQANEDSVEPRRALAPPLWLLVGLLLALERWLAATESVA